MHVCMMHTSMILDLDACVYDAANFVPGDVSRICISLGQKKKILDLGFALHRAVLYRYQDPPKKISNL